MNLGAVNTLVFDLDGVVWRGNSPIQGAVEAIMQLKAAGKRCLYCTNNSSQTPAAFVEKLAGLGIEAAEDDIITSSTATALYLSAQYTGPFLAYVIGGEGIQAAIQKIGARIIYDRDIDDGTRVDCVVAGIDRSFTYEKLNTAQRLIRSGALFVATNRDATYPVEHGVIPGAGSIVSAIETASGSTPVTIGKPRPVMVQLVQQKFKLQANEIAFIGDRLDTDVVCARRAGVAAILVLTGVTTLQQARRAKGEMRPDAVFPDLPSLVGVVIDNSPAPELNPDELPSFDGAAASAEPVTQGAPRQEAEFLPMPGELQAPSAAAQSTPAAPDFTATFATETATATTIDELPNEATPNEAAPSEAVPSEAVDEVPVVQSPSDVEAGSLGSFGFEDALSVDSAATSDSATTDSPTTESASTPSSGGDALEVDDSWFSTDTTATEGETSSGAEPEVTTETTPEATTEEKSETASSNFSWKLD